MSSREGYHDLPDDFFTDLADESLIEEDVDREDDDPQLNRCLEEIKVLERKIEKKRQVIKERQDGLTSEERLRQKTRDGVEGRSRTRSRSRDREIRRHRERERRRRSKSRSRSPRNRSPHSSKKYDERFKDRRHGSPLRNRPLRRSRSRSQSPFNHRSKHSSSTHKNFSFLEELAQKFAEKRQAFPEKDALLMGQNPNQLNNNAIDPNGLPMPMEFGNIMSFDQQMIQPMGQPMIPMPNFQPQVAFPLQQGMNLSYGMNPMSILAGNSIPPPAVPNMAPFPGLGQPDIPAIGAHSGPIPPVESALSESQRASIINRCEQAIKLIRAKDNKVPIMKFPYNRTSLVNSNEQNIISSVNKSPLNAHSTLNPTFKMNAPPNTTVKMVNGLKMLPSRVKDVAQSLSINSSFLFDKMRTKEINAQITSQIKSGMEREVSPDAEVLFQTSTVSIPTIETAEMATQTNEFKCVKCIERKRTTVSAGTQVFLKNCSIGVQTNEKDYREPIVELLSKMTAAQLVALKDFAHIIDELRACSELKYSRIRERLIDIYNLSQRDADTVRAAEESHMDEIAYMDQRRFRTGEAYMEGSARDFDRRSKSPGRFNGTFMGDRPNFEPNDRGMTLDERAAFQRGLMNDRFQGLDEPYPRPVNRIDEEEREERQRQIYLEMERRRELELEMNQRRYDEQMELEREQRERDRERELRLEQERRMQNFQPPNTLPFEDEMRQFNRNQEERESQRSNLFNNRGVMNRRGRGAFRDNFRGARGSRR